MRPITLLFGLLLLAADARAGDTLLPKLRALAPEADPVALRLALQARVCAQQRGLAPVATRLAVIDFSRPSVEPRLWVFDLAGPSLLFTEHVAHGRATGDNLAREFSNRDGSHQSSLGLYVAAESYHGSNGYSLRLDGLEPGLNDRARPRAIVMHGADYVNPALALQQGRLGRSFGCPAVRPQVARALIDELAGGQLVYAYHASTQWQADSNLLDCAGDSLLAGAAPAADAVASP